MNYSHWRPQEVNSNIATREQLLKKLPTIIAQRRGQLIIVHYDIQLVAFPQGRQMFFAWVVVLECVGALLGPGNNCVYSHIVIDPATNFVTPLCPNDDLLEASVIASMLKLNTIRARQLTHGTPPSPN
jgi:hypothetical protein